MKMKTKGNTAIAITTEVTVVEESVEEETGV